MIAKQIALLNWVLGTIALLGALLAPIGIEKFSAQPRKDILVIIVQQIVREQKNVIAQGKDFISFGRNETARGFQQLKLDIPTDDFAYDAFREPNGDLVIRGMTTESSLMNSMIPIPPFIYSYTIPADGNDDLKEFIELSGKPRGLGLIDLFSF